ncbi:sensor histidine kinase [Acidovorax lacteus]
MTLPDPVLPAAPAAPSASHIARSLLRRGLAMALFCTAIAVLLTLAGHGRWWEQWVYSNAIGLLSWLVIDAGRVLIARHEEGMWPHGPRGLLLVAVGTLVGLVGGTALGDAVSGGHTWALIGQAPERALFIALVTIAASVVASFYYHARGTAQALEARAARAQRDLTETRLKLLEAQLEPHMMFNTLANLRVLVATDPPRAQAMLDHLIDYLRATLGGSRQLSHPLADEFARLRDYFELMAVRMGPRLQYTLDLPEALRSTAVPPLLLQPLAENAIRHGLEPSVPGGHIAVRARAIESAHGPLLQIEVQDTGVGLHSHAEAPLPAGGGGFGLTQVRERLATLHGAQARLELTPLAPQGTCARIVLPLNPSPA